MTDHTTKRQWTDEDTARAVARENRAGMRRLIDSDLDGALAALGAGDTKTAWLLVHRAKENNQKAAHGEDPRIYGVECPNGGECVATAHSGAHATKAQAIAAWNTRAPSPAEVERLTREKAELERMLAGGSRDTEALLAEKRAAKSEWLRANAADATIADLRAKLEEMHRRAQGAEGERDKLLAVQPLWAENPHGKSYAALASRSLRERDQARAALENAQHNEKVTEENGERMITGLRRSLEEIRAKLAKARSSLEWLNRKGGLGLDVHNVIDATLAALRDEVGS